MSWYFLCLIFWAPNICFPLWVAWAKWCHEVAKKILDPMYVECCFDLELLLTMSGRAFICQLLLEHSYAFLVKMASDSHDFNLCMSTERYSSLTHGHTMHLCLLCALQITTSLMHLLCAAVSRRCGLMDLRWSYGFLDLC